MNTKRVVGALVIMTILFASHAEARWPWDWLPWNWNSKSPSDADVAKAFDTVQRAPDQDLREAIRGSTQQKDVQLAEYNNQISALQQELDAAKKVKKDLRAQYGRLVGEANGTADAGFPTYLFTDDAQDASRLAETARVSAEASQKISEAQAKLQEARGNVEALESRIAGLEDQRNALQMEREALGIADSTMDKSVANLRGKLEMSLLRYRLDLMQQRMVAEGEGLEVLKEAFETTAIAAYMKAQLKQIEAKFCDVARKCAEGGKADFDLDEMFKSKKNRTTDIEGTR